MIRLPFSHSAQAHEGDFAMADATTIAVSPADIESLGTKLAEFGGQLPPNEQALFQLILARAAAAGPAPLEGDDSQGYIIVQSQFGNAGLALGLQGSSFRSTVLGRFAERGIIIVGG
jgi:hypothetical protein